MADLTIHLAGCKHEFVISSVDRDWRSSLPLPASYRPSKLWFPGQAPFLWTVYAHQADMQEQHARKKKEGIIT